MPIAVIAVLVIAVLGVGAYFITSDSEPMMNEPDATEVARTEVESSSDDLMQDAEVSGGMDDEEDMMNDATDSGMMGSSMPDDETAVATPFTSSQTYLTPARTSHDMDITLTIASDGTVVGANIVYDNGDGFSNGHQERFDGAYRDLVIGQQLSEIELSRTGGASLTSEAFNAAVADIQAQRG